MNERTNNRVIIVTGSGRGLGRAHALTLAEAGFSVVVNDLGAALDGSGIESSPAFEVVQEIREHGGRAIDDTSDVASWAGAEQLVKTAIETFGRLDGLVLSAGNIRDRDLADMSYDDWNTIVSVHLNGHAAPLHFAARHWRAIAEKTGEPSGGRAVLTTSTAGIYNEPGRANYNSAKSGIISLGRTAAKEFAAFGATANIIAPFARSRMTISLEPGLATLPNEGTYDPLDPANISPLVVWLMSESAAYVNGELFEIHAGYIGIIEEAKRGRSVQKYGQWQVHEINDAIEELLP